MVRRGRRSGELAAIRSSIRNHAVNTSSRGIEVVVAEHHAPGDVLGQVKIVVTIELEVIVVVDTSNSRKRVVSCLSVTLIAEFELFGRQNTVSVGVDWQPHVCQIILEVVNAVSTLEKVAVGVGLHRGIVPVVENPHLELHRLWNSVVHAVRQRGNGTLELEIGNLDPVTNAITLTSSLRNINRRSTNAAVKNVLRAKPNVIGRHQVLT